MTLEQIMSKVKNQLVPLPSVFTYTLNTRPLTVGSPAHWDVGFILPAISPLLYIYYRQSKENGCIRDILYTLCLLQYTILYTVGSIRDTASISAAALFKEEVREILQSHTLRLEGQCCLFIKLSVFFVAPWSYFAPVRSIRAHSAVVKRSCESFVLTLLLSQ